MAFPFGRPSESWSDRSNPKFLAISTDSRGNTRRRPAPRPRPGDAETPRVLFESLEQRYLLSADISPLTVAMADVGHDLTVRFDGSQFEISNDQTGQVVGEQQASRTGQVQIIGSGQDDRLTIELTAGFALPFGISFNGGGGNDQMLLTGAVDAVSHLLNGDGSNQILVSSGQMVGKLISSGLEQVTDSLTAQSRMITVSGAGNDAMLTNAGDGSAALTTARGDALDFGGAAARTLGIDAEGADLFSKADLRAEQIALHGDALSVGGELDARGDVGGMIDLTGGLIDVLGTAFIDARGLGDGGTVHIGGNFHGAGPLQNAENTMVEQGAAIDVSATQFGHGGSADVWADGSTFFAGSILARGGSAGGDGGFVEVSGKGTLAFEGSVDAGASAGSAGTLLLDPSNVDIAPGAAGSGSLDAGGTPFTAATATSTISVGTLEGISATTNISITASDNITIDNLSGNPLSLLTTAGHSVTLSAGSTFSFANAGDEIETAGGDISITAVTIGKLGSFNVASGTLTLDASGSDITLNTITAGTLNVTAAAGNISEVGGSTITVSGTATLNAGTHDVDLTGATFSIGTLNVTAGRVVAAGTNVTLTNSTVVFGGETAHLTGVTKARLNADATLATTLDASAFTGAVVLAAGTGDDILKGATGPNAVTTYVFGGLFGTDTITAQANNNDVLDFIGSVSNLTVSGDKTVITDTSVGGGTFTQTTPVTGIDADLTATVGLQTAFMAFFAGLITTAGKLETADPIPEIDNQLPLLNSLKNSNGRNASLAGALGLSDVLGAIFNIGPTPTTLSGLIAALNAIPVTTASGDETLGLHVSGAKATYMGGTGSGGQLALLADVTFTAERKESFPIDFGVQAELAGITLAGSIDLDTNLNAHLVGGVITGPTLTPSLHSAELDFTVAGSATLTNASLSLGFLEATVSGTVSLSGGVNVALSADLQNFGAPTGTATLVSPSLSVNLPITVSSTGLDAATVTLLNSAAPHLTLTLPPGASLFSDGLADDGPVVPVLDAAGSGGVDLANFGNVTSSQVLGMLDDLYNSLTSLTASQILQTTIPFTNTTLGDELGFATRFADDVLNPLFAQPSIQVVEQTHGGGGKNEVQVITVLDAFQGTYTLTFGGNTTSPALAWNATADTVQTALTGLASIGANNVAVQRTKVTNGFQYTITFQNGKGNSSEPLITASDSGLKIYPDSMKFREKLLVFGGLMDSAGGHDSGRFSQRGGS
jgi:hypothetical protein